MKEPKARFVLAEATLAEVNKQLRLNMLVMVAVVFVLFMNIMKFMVEKSVLYAVLAVIMICLLFFIQKARGILILRKQELTHK
ncbi:MULTISPECIES: hypothetical protein [Psychrobacter]|jgi:hypothetical protein|uniref:Uncharacterized protein n=1 Tax=Psychrobacter pocilloporae TaxID=1775882 RepID=A0ABT6IUR5_9GAMM|nr:MULTISPECIES: hypothetical protein [Psychrobacter]MDH4905565.1 hypothetical protein [Psychrobacter pocilloporae]MED6316875.1 hypothetical protein [Pseudomonadota bacterium]|tara:strand:- start:15202 stop:15450 length:249 start_codon:yes stop_codon:yes gene_type:complete